MELSGSLLAGVPRNVGRRLVRFPVAARELHREFRFEARALGLLYVLSTTGTIAAPALQHRPLLLMALSPRFVFVALAARESPLALFVAIGLVRLTVADPIHFSIGRAMRLRRGRGRLLERLRPNRTMAAAGVLVRPTGPVVAYAGSSGLAGVWVASLDIVSTTVYLVAVHAGMTRVF